MRFKIKLIKTEQFADCDNSCSLNFRRRQMSPGSPRFVSTIVAMCLVIGIVVLGHNANAQTVIGQDSLWAFADDSLSVCIDPSSDDAIQNCFKDMNTSPSESTSSYTPTPQLIATDGSYVYAATQKLGFGKKCPVSGYGADCEEIAIGPYTDDSSEIPFLTITAIVATVDFLWTAQSDGTIWRCPNHLPWSGIISYSPPAGCQKFNDAYPRAATSLALANGYLYAGLAKGITPPKSGLIWRCGTEKVNDCADFNKPGDVGVTSLVVGAGKLWAGLANGIVWNCGLYDFNDCDVWNKAGYEINYISYDGQGKLGVAVLGNSEAHKPKNGVVWSCPTATKNACETIIQNTSSHNVLAFSTASIPGAVFSSVWLSNQTNGFTQMYKGAVAYNTPMLNWKSGATLLYVPVGGPAILGSAKIKIPLTGPANALSKFCDRWHYLRATITVKGVYGGIRRSVNLCRLRSADQAEVQFGALDDGWYNVSVSVGFHKGSETFYLGKNVGVKEVTVNTARWRR